MLSLDGVCYFFFTLNSLFFVFRFFCLFFCSISSPCDIVSMICQILYFLQTKKKNSRKIWKNKTDSIPCLVLGSRSLNSYLKCVMKPTKNCFLCNVWKNKLCVVHFRIGHHYEAIVYVSFSQHIVSVWFSTERLNIIVPIFLRWFHVYWLRLCLSVCRCVCVCVRECLRRFSFYFLHFFFLINYCFRCDCVCVSACVCMHLESVSLQIWNQTKVADTENISTWSHISLYTYIQCILSHTFFFFSLSFALRCRSFLNKLPWFCLFVHLILFR